MLSASTGPPVRVPITRKKGVFGRLARPAKRHYTFARPALIVVAAGANTASQARKALICQLFLLPSSIG